MPRGIRREDILRKGYAEIPITIAGVRRKHKFILRVKQSPDGPYPILETSPRVPERELVRISNEVMLPITNGKSTVFPIGTSPSDFISLI